MSLSPLTIDEFGPLPVRRPASAAELGEVVREAAAKGHGVYPAGGRTTLDVGLPPTKPGVAVDTTGLNAVVDYPARDMTITVGAGITVGKLQELLGKEGQWLPVDVPDPARATLGGAVALNKSGPRRYGYGTLRDYVIGIRFVTDEGNEVGAGGRVVKNVAGYDLMKLQTGAVGTLGVVTQLTLKVRPKPEASAVVRMACADAALAGVLDRLHESRSRPAAVEVTSGGGTIGAAWDVWVLFEEKAATVEWQVSALLDEFRTALVTDVTAERGAAALDRVRALAGATPPPGRPRLGVKAVVRPGRTAALCGAAREAGSVHAHGLSGVVYVGPHDRFLRGDPPQVAELSRDGAAALVARLAGVAADAGGLVTVPHCPTAWKTELPVWGRPTADRDLMRHVKKTLDPGDVFNPGRLFGPA